MPALDLAWSRVDARLAAVQYRIHAQLALRFAFQTAAVGGGLATAVLGATLLLPTAAFPPLVWIAAAASAGSLAWFAVRAWRGRVDRLQTARLVDARADLQERLTTLVACPSTPAAAPLLNLVVAQVLAREVKWRPEAIVPAKIPLAAYAAAATWCLALGLWLAAPSLFVALAERAQRAAAERADGELPSQPSDQTPTAAEPAAGVAALPSDAPATDGAGEPAAGAGDTTGAASLPQRLRTALLDRLTDDGAGERRQGHLHGATADESGNGAGVGEERSDGDALAEAAEPRGSSSHLGQGEPPPGYAKLTTSAAAPGSAGDGAGPEPNAATAPVPAAADKRFRLTLNSFLRASEQGSVAQDGRSARAARPGSVAPNPNHKPDHPLYRAAVPPAYAHVVRDVYSWRPQP